MRFMTVGLGHCGGKIANDFKKMATKQKGFIVDVCAINTDRADLATHRNIPDRQKLIIGTGKGAAKNWKEGMEASIQSKNNIRELIKRTLTPETDVILITAGEGGGSGSGIAPTIAEIIEELGKTCIAIVTLPFETESVKTKVNAAMGLDQLYRKEALKTLICIDNDKITAHFPQKTITEAYEEVNRAAIGTFINLLKLAKRPSKADRIDESEMASIFEYPGFATLANFRTKSNLVDDLAAMLRHSWNGSLLADINPSTATAALFGIEGPNHIFKTTQVDAVRRTFRESLIGRDVMLGIYPMKRSRWTAYVGILTGMDVPEKVRRLLEIAKQEYRTHEEVLEERRKMKTVGLGFRLGYEKEKTEELTRKVPLLKAEDRLRQARDWLNLHQDQLEPYLRKAFRYMERLRGRRIHIDELVKLLSDELSLDDEQMVLATIAALQAEGYIVEKGRNTFLVL